VGRCGLDVSISGLGPVAGSCDCGNEPSESIKGREFLDCVTVSFSRTLLHRVSQKPCIYFDESLYSRKVTFYKFSPEFIVLS
jgi:hypothetical protein